MMAGVEVYLGLGSDLGDRKGNLLDAIGLLDEAFGCRFSALSGFHETEPWGFESDTIFLNVAVKYVLSVPRGTTRRDFAYWILDNCKGIERKMGRSGEPEYDAGGNRIYRSRIIDIDILMIGDWTVDEEDLKIPHPLMRKRDFVMVPLSEIISDNSLFVRPVR